MLFFFQKRRKLQRDITVKKAEHYVRCIFNKLADLNDE